MSDEPEVGHEGGFVVVGVDGSDESLAALDWAGAFAERFGCELRLVAAWHLPTPYVRAISANDLEHEADRRASDAAELTRAHHPGVKVEERIVVGSPGAELVAESAHARALVVGTRRTLGSVSSYCAHYATCPLVVVRTEGEPL